MTLGSPAFRRIVALGLLVAVLAVGYALVVRPIQATFAKQDAKIAADRDLLRRYRQIASEKASLNEELEALRRRPPAREAYLSGESESLIGATIQNRVRQIIEQHRAKLNSAQALPAVDVDGFRRITVRVRMNSGIDAMRRVFYDLEGEIPYLFLDNIDIGSRGSRRRGRDLDTDVDDLNVSFEVYGFVARQL